jgi:hypothetical protein
VVALGDAESTMPSGQRVMFGVADTACTMPSGQRVMFGVGDAVGLDERPPTVYGQPEEVRTCRNATIQPMRSAP